MVRLAIEAEDWSQGQTVVSARLNHKVIARDRVDLSSAADRQRYAEVIHREVPAVDIDDVNQRLLEIGAPVMRSPLSVPDEPWPTPTPLEAVDLPAFPVEVLPEPIRSMVAETAEATQTPADMAGLLALAACAGAVAGAIVIASSSGWREPVNLYAACILGPGNRKSAVFDRVFSPIKAIEKELVKQAGPEIARRTAERRCKESEMKKCETKAGNGGDDCEKARQRAINLAEELYANPIPSRPQLVTSDATAEKVECLLRDQEGRLIIASAEGGIFDIMAGRYTAGASNLDVFLKGHSGDDLRTDRIGRDSVMVERPCLTLAFAIQPDVIRRLASKSEFRGRGLAARFLFAMPESPLGNRRISPEPVRPATTSAYEALIRRLYALSAVAAAQESGACLKLSGEASRLFTGWCTEVESMLADGGQLAMLQDWGGKLCGVTARLAAILHLVESDRPEPWLDAVSEQAMESAIALARWAIPHAEATFRLMSGGGGTHGDAAYVLKRLRDLSRSEVTRRDIQNQGRSRFDQEPDRLDEALQELVDRQWIRPLAMAGRAGPGRKPSPRYQCHPSLVSGE